MSKGKERKRFYNTRLEFVLLFDIEYISVCVYVCVLVSYEWISISVLQVHFSVSSVTFY